MYLYEATAGALYHENPEWGIKAAKLGPIDYLKPDALTNAQY